MQAAIKSKNNERFFHALWSATWRFPYVFLLAGAVCELAVAGETDPFYSRFDSATAPYNRGDYADAAREYGALLEEGAVAPEFLFNLGNAYYRMDQPGLAALAYRRAEHLSPRDAEIRANRERVTKRWGSVHAIQGPLKSVLTQATLEEWIGVAVLGWWGLFTGWAGASCSHRWRNRWRLAALPPAALLLLGLGGVAHWNSESVRSEWIVTRTGEKALFAPLSDAQPHFDLPPGSTVRWNEARWPWIKVSVNEKTGWIQEESCVRVCDAPYI